MNWEEYVDTFSAILNGEIKEPPYDQPAYLEYVSLNYSRLKRWLKTIRIEQKIKDDLHRIVEPQTWILIVEPWCADAANSASVLYKMALESPLITLDIQLRDSPPYLIENYLTNGNKSIPILIVRDQSGKDLFTWGSRPGPCQQLAILNKKLAISDREKKALIQSWYNNDKGASVQEEVMSLQRKYHRPEESYLSPQV